MIKQNVRTIRLLIPANKATPGNPVGPILGQYGINLLNFCKEYNDRTKHLLGSLIPVKVTIYNNKSYSFVLKSEPTVTLLLRSANINKGSSNPKKSNIGTISMDNILQIAKVKLKDLNVLQLDKACSIILGTAKSIGLQVLPS